MPTNPMLSAGHMGIVDALKYGVTRNDTTVAAALAAIGGTPAFLLLPLAGDGLWTFNTTLTIPTNVTLLNAPGIAWNGIGHVIINGNSISVDPNINANFVAGGGTITTNYVQIFIGSLSTNRLAANDFNANRAGFDQIVAGPGGTSVNPAHALELLANDAYKPGTNTWTISPSDARAKIKLRPYNVGLELIRAVESYWYVYNGKAGTRVDGTEYVGIMAQELQPHAPYMVGSSRGKLEPDDAEETDILNYDGHAMTFALINAVKELAARVEALEAAASPP